MGFVDEGVRVGPFLRTLYRGAMVVAEKKEKSVRVRGSAVATHSVRHSGVGVKRVEVDIGWKIQHRHSGANCKLADSVQMAYHRTS